MRVCCLRIGTVVSTAELVATELLLANLSALVSTERVVSTSTCRYRAHVQGITELLRGNLSALVGTERVYQLTASQ